MQETEVKKGFDFTVHHRDERTGEVVKTTPYTLRISSDGSANGRTRLLERPPGSGNIFNKKGDPIGRWEKDAKGKGTFKPDAPHIEFAAPETEDQKLSRAVLEKDSRISALEAELAAIKAESETRNKPKAKDEKGA